VSTGSSLLDVHLFDSDGERSIAPANVFFTFGDGRFRYDCVTCGAKCCRGHGYAVAPGKELATHARLRPELPLFLDATTHQGRRKYAMRNCAPGCFFLSESGRCGVQEVHGYTAKPETCRLFPFNNLRRFGRFLIVSPHPDLCPLSVVPPGDHDRLSDHQALLHGLVSQGVRAPVREVTAGIDDEEATVARERDALDATEGASGADDYLTCAKAQVHAVGLDQVATKKACQRMTEMIEVSSDLLGTPAASMLGEDPQLVQTMIGVTPYLRSRFVFQDKNADSSAALPIGFDQVPLSMLATYLLAESARRAGMQRVTFQTISKLSFAFDGLVRLIANLDAVLVWRRGAPIFVSQFESSDSRIAYARIVKSLMPRKQRRHPQRLGELLIEHAPRHLFERQLFVKEVAKCLAGKLRPIDTSPAPVPESRPNLRMFRASLQRWVFCALDESLVRAIYDRQYTEPPAPRLAR
jgi:hypothetical protein